MTWTVWMPRGYVLICPIEYFLCSGVLKLCSLYCSNVNTCSEEDQ